MATADAQALNLWDSTTGKLHLRRPWPAELVYRKGWSPAWSLKFMPNGRTLATGLDDGTIAVWDLGSETVAYPPTAKKLDETTLNQSWTDLLANDASRAYKAIQKLTQAPEQTLPFLRERLQAKTDSDVKLAKRLIADLDSSEFAVRERAAKKLTDMGEMAEPALLLALSGRLRPKSAAEPKLCLTA